MLKKLFFILFVFGIIIPLIVLGCAEPATPPSQPPSSGPPTPAPAPAPELIKLKAIQFLPMNNPGSKPFQTLVGRINEAAEGQLNIEIAGGPETIAQQEQAEAVRSGAVDIAMTPWAYFRSMVPVSAVVNMARIESSDDLLPGTPLNDFLVAEFEKANIRLLSEITFKSPFYMFTMEPANSLDDLKGLRMRTSAAFPFLEALGIVATTLEHGDIYTAIERGLIDGTPNKLSSFISDGMAGLIMYQPGPGFWGVGNIPFLMNGDAWNELPKPLQDLIIDEIIAYQPIKNKGDEGYNTSSWKKILDTGLERIEWSEADNKRMLDTIDGYMLNRAEKTVDPETLAKYKELAGF